MITITSFIHFSLPFLIIFHSLIIVCIIFVSALCSHIPYHSYNISIHATSYCHSSDSCISLEFVPFNFHSILYSIVLDILMDSQSIHSNHLSKVYQYQLISIQISFQIYSFRFLPSFSSRTLPVISNRLSHSCCAFDISNLSFLYFLLHTLYTLLSVPKTLYINLF